MAKYRKTELSLKERADKVGLEKKLFKLIPIIMSCIFVLSALIYVISVVYAKYGDFTIAIDNMQNEGGLSLSRTKDFQYATSILNFNAEKDIRDSSGTWLPENLGSVDGEDNGDNYLCYTFYLKNPGKSAVSFNYSIGIDKMTLGVEKAVRIRLITSINGGETTAVDYARISDKLDEFGQPLKEEVFCDEAFYLRKTVCDKRIDSFQPEDKMKITVVIWLEGDDPECVDDIIGGEFKISMHFKINGASAEE